MVGAVVVVLAAAGIVAITVDPEPESGMLSWPEMAAPAAVEAPRGPDDSAPMPSSEDVTAALEGTLGGKGLKDKTTATVLDGFTGETLLDVDGSKSVTPASSTKVTSSAAVLATRGPEYRIPTVVVEGEKPGEVVLVGNGDVTLSTGDEKPHYTGAGSLTDLADQVTEALGKAPERLVVDNSAFADEDVAPGVPKGDLEVGYTARMAPMMLDGGREDPKQQGSGAKRHEDPAGEVAKALGEKMGMDNADIATGEAPEDAKELGKVHSPTMQRLSDIALVASDNLLADALAHQAALASQEQGSFEGGAQATVELMKSLEIPTDGVNLKDGSGLSPKNELTSAALAGFIQKAVSGEHSNIAGLLSGLPVAGYSGTLDDRYHDGDSADGAGKVRAKTGTLSNVSSLTGMVVTPDGRPLAYAFVFNGKSGAQIDEELDKLATSLSKCC